MPCVCAVYWTLWWGKAGPQRTPSATGTSAMRRQCRHCDPQLVVEERPSCVAKEQNSYSRHTVPICLDLLGRRLCRDQFWRDSGPELPSDPGYVWGCGYETIYELFLAVPGDFMVQTSHDSTRLISYNLSRSFTWAFRSATCNTCASEQSQSGCQEAPVQGDGQRKAWRQLWFPAPGPATLSVSCQGWKNQC